MRWDLGHRADVDYQVARSNSQWPDHRLRVLETAGLIAHYQPATVLDPACGDGSVLAEAHRLWPIGLAHLADISRPSIEALDVPFTHSARVMGIEEAIESSLAVDMIVLTEILEHLADPDRVLRLARLKARYLVASSPLISDGIDANPEHLWAFDRDGYTQMLEQAGWVVRASVVLDQHSYYVFQLHAAE